MYFPVESLTLMGFLVFAKHFGHRPLFPGWEWSPVYSLYKEKLLGDEIGRARAVVRIQEEQMQQTGKGDGKVEIFCRKIFM